MASNEVKTMSTLLENFLVTSPGKTFCSWIAVNIFFLIARYSGNAQEYPPVPMTKSGLKFLNIF